MESATDSASLVETFVHRTSTHQFKISWTRYGAPDRPAVVFVHGTPWSSVVWEDLANTLSSRYTIYVYDHPGFGVSPAPNRLAAASNQAHVDLDASLTLRAEASAALFKHWDFASPPHVVAHDNGGLVSLRLLLQHDIRLASLCLIDVVAMSRGGVDLPFFKLVVENEHVFKALPTNFVEGLVRAYVKSAMFKEMPRHIEDLLSAPWLENGLQGTEAFLREPVQAHKRDTRGIESEYARVGSLQPTKLIWGRDDAWIPVSTAEKLKTALNADSVTIIDEAGHLVHYDQPSKLALEVGLWLGNQIKS